MGFFEEHWLWRGTQSAIFYYASCAPCIDARYQKKRRKEAAQAEKTRARIGKETPGIIQQPGAFETNQEWAEEILIGPGPPKGWKQDPIVQKVPYGQRQKIIEGGPTDTVISSNDASCHRVGAVNVSAHSPGPTLVTTSPLMLQPALSEAIHVALSTQGTQSTHGNEIDFQTLSPITEQTSRRSESSLSHASTSTSEASRRGVGFSRPSMERKLSNAIDTLRDTLRSSMRPEKWNWKRYEREDEVLSGFNIKMSRMWDRATIFGYGAQSDTETKVPTQSRKRTFTNESDRPEYQQYSRNPEVNDLHPPVVSQLPATRDHAAWMLLPPPSAAVMEGKTRPQDEPGLRWPLAKIGRNHDEWEVLKRQRVETYKVPVQNERDERGEQDELHTIPDLSNSSSEDGSSDRDSFSKKKRHSDPIPGWKPVKLPTPTLSLIDVKETRKGWRDREHWWIPTP